MVKSGTGLLCIPGNPTNREQYLNRREIRLSIIRQYESQNETELIQEKIDMVDNDPQLQGWHRNRPQLNGFENNYSSYGFSSRP